jgi:hypothetical protein
MNIEYGNLLAVALTAFLFVSASSSCASGKVESRPAQATPSPAPSKIDPPSAETVFPDRLPADLPVGPVRLTPSTIDADLIKYKEGHPAAAAKELADYGNSLILVKGYNYNIDVNALNERHKKTARKISEDFQVYPYTMTLTGGKNEAFMIFAPTSDSCCCGYFYADFPVTNITATLITFVSDGKTYTVKRPKELSVSEVYALVDMKDPRKEVRKWQVPYETYPSGISEDGTKLYVEGPIEDVLLEIASDGGFKLVPKTDVTSGEGEHHPYPKNPKNAYESYMKFQAGTKTYYIKFSGPCT